MVFENYESDFILLTRMSYGLFWFGLVIFGILVFTSYAPAYGRHGASWVEKVLFLDKLYVPANLAWFIQELPAITIPFYLYFSGKCSNSLTWTNTAIMSLYFLHYIHRCFLFPLLIRGGKPMPLHYNMIATCVCAYNGFLQCYYHCAFTEYPENYLKQFIPITGIILFLIGMTINITSDAMLRNLRKPGETGYKIPRGFMFEYVSGANFFGEIVEWFGFALAAGTHPAAVFSFFTLCNIIPRARAHHKWYLQKFDDYPKSRKAVIPFIL